MRAFALALASLLCTGARRLSSTGASVQRRSDEVASVPAPILSEPKQHPQKSVAKLLQTVASPAAGFAIPGPCHGLATKHLHGTSAKLAVNNINRVRAGLRPAVPTDSHLKARDNIQLSALISQLLDTPPAPVHDMPPWMPNEWLQDLFDNTPEPLGVGSFEIQQVVDTLKVDISNLLHKEPHWEIFAENFKVINQTGTQLEGLESIRRLSQLLRGVGKHLVSKQDIQVRFIDGRGLFGPVDPFVVARFKVQVAQDVFQECHDHSSVDVEAETVFHLNEKKQVDYMRIDKWLVNGHELKFWPEVELFDNPAASLRKIEEWAQDISLSGLFGRIDGLRATEKAKLLEEARRAKPWKKAHVAGQPGVGAGIHVIDFGSGYTRANFVELGTDGSVRSRRVEGFRGMPLQRALSDPRLTKQLVDELADALPSGRILAGATAGVRFALERGSITQEQVQAFEEVFARKLGARARFNVLSKEEEAKAEWMSVEYALHSMEQMGAPGVPKLQTVHGMLSSGGVSCQFACRNGQGGPEFCSFDNLIGDGFLLYDKQAEAAGADFAKILSEFEASVRKNVAATKMRGLKGTYILTELWNTLSFKGKGFGPAIIPYQSVPVSDVLTAIQKYLREELSSTEPLSRQQAKVILVATIGRIVFQELFDPSALVSFMDGDDMNWSIGWTCMKENAPGSN